MEVVASPAETETEGVQENWDSSQMVKGHDTEQITLEHDSKSFLALTAWGSLFSIFLLSLCSISLLDSEFQLFPVFLGTNEV